MLPRGPSYNVTDNGLANAKERRQSRLRDCTRCIASTDIAYRVVRQFGIDVLLTTRLAFRMLMRGMMSTIQATFGMLMRPMVVTAYLASFLDHIPRVISRRPKKEMLRPNATRRIASVQAIQFIRNRTVGECVGNAMRLIFPLPVRHVAIASCRYSASPEPTRIGFPDSRPEAIRKGTALGSVGTSGGTVTTDTRWLLRVERLAAVFTDSVSRGIVGRHQRFSFGVTPTAVRAARGLCYVRIIA